MIPSLYLSQRLLQRGGKAFLPPLQSLSYFKRTYASIPSPPPARRMVDLFINDMNVSVPEGTTIIQACDTAGIHSINQ